jgi:hypothetical protein
MLSVAMGILRDLTPPRGQEHLLFPRVEAARKPGKIPKGAVRHDWNPPGGGAPVAAFWWLNTAMTGDQWTKNMRAFLAPIIGGKQALSRIPSGLRGGGEMELVELGTSVRVRATVGWWRRQRLSAEGPMITYEGCSTEAMATETSFLGSVYIKVLAPGVYTTIPPAPHMRSIRLRVASENIFRTVVARQGERTRYLARKAAAAAAAKS